MKKSILLGLLCLSALYVGVSLLWVESTKLKRHLLAKDALASAKQLATKSQDAEALEVAELLSRAEIAYPALWGAIQEDPQKQPSVLVFMFTPGDQYIGPYWMYWYAVSLRNCAASHAVMFAQKHEWIALHTGQYNQIWQGLLALHEGKHSLYKQKGIDLWNTALDELEARKLVLRVCQSVGGKPYISFIQSIEQQFEHSWKGSLFTFSIPQDYPPELEKIWGKPLSKNEEAVQVLYAYLHAVFNHFEKVIPDKALQGELEIASKLL